MGTKTHNNYEDLITFTRASAGHALRPVSYGSELVTNGDGSSVTNWDSPRSNSTLSVNSGRLRATASASGAYGIAQTLSNLTVGAIYFYSANIYADGGSGNMIFRISALSTLDNQPVSDEQSTTRLVSGSFVATASTMYVGGIHVASSAGDYIELDNVSIKEVTFDESDGTLTLFEHPNNVPRVEYDADRNRLGLLVEEARTNSLTYSEDFSNSAYSKAGASVTADQATAPNGTTTADLLTSSDTTAQHQVQAPTVSFVSGQKYTNTWFVKSGTHDYVQVLFFSAAFGSNAYANFDLSTGATGTVGSAATASITDVGNNWYRLEVTADATTTATSRTSLNFVTSSTALRNENWAADGTETIYVWGAQLETGSFPTSYIKTTGSTATRSADVASIPVADFGYNSAKGTVVCEFNFNYEDGGSGFPRPLELGNSSSANERINIYVSESSGNLSAAINTNGSNQANFTLKSATGGSVSSKVAFGWEKNNVAASDDGDTVLTDTSANVLPTGSPRNTLTFGGSTLNANSNITGHIKSIKYYPRRLTNAQLEDLSS